VLRPLPAPLTSELSLRALARFLPGQAREPGRSGLAGQLLSLEEPWFLILTTRLLGVAAKLGIGLAALAVTRLFSTTPAPTAAEPRRTFAEELERARPLPTVDAPLGPAAATTRLARATGDAAGRPVAAAPPLTTDRAQLALAVPGGPRAGLGE
jgi:hypothetical protein